MNQVSRGTDNLQLAVIQPATAEDVSAAIKWCVSNSITFVAVGGGHSTSQSNCTDTGVCIDLRANMKTVTVDASAKRITAGGGANWAEVDAAGAEHGLATVGGTVNHTGIGGLSLGGGYGWLSPQYGLTCDNIVSATVVLADGRIVRTSETDEPDLFWAIRGAGQSFGIVTEFTYKAYEQGPVFGGVLIFPGIDKLKGVVDFANYLHDNNDGRQAIIWGFSAPPPHSAPATLASLFYNGPEKEAREYFKPLLELGAVMDTTGMMPYEQINSILNQSVGYGGRKVFGGSNFTMPLSLPFVQQVADQFIGIITSEERAGESVCLFECLPGDVIRKVPNDAMAFANRGEYYSFGLCWKWYDPAQDTKFRQHNRQIADFVREQAGTKNAQDVGQYSNYLGADEKTERVFGQNTEKLRHLKSRYDPDNQFNKWHNLLAN